jgi:hypothetical protein
MSDNPRFEMPQMSGDYTYVSRLEGQESFTTYLVAMLNDDAHSIVYLGSVQWSVNWRGTFDEEQEFHGQMSQVGAAVQGHTGHARTDGPPANHGGDGRFVRNRPPPDDNGQANHDASGHAPRRGSHRRR